MFICKIETKKQIFRVLNLNLGFFLVMMMMESYIEEDDVSVGVSIVMIDSVESLRELNITKLFTKLWIH